jgi:hypothetical protein
LLLILLLPTLVLAADPLPVPARPVVLFDQGHGQRFLIEDKGTLHLSSLAGIIAGSNATVTSSTAPLTDDTLAPVSALVISGAFQPLQGEEVAAVTRFVERGGRLAIMIHIPQPLDQLLTRLEVNFTNYVLREQKNVIGNDPLNFQVVDLTSSELFAGVKGVSVYGAWALTNTAPSVAVVARTSGRAWVDVDGDRQLSAGDVAGTFGVAVLGTLGKGRYLVLGDDALFQNRFMDEQNSTFAVNLAKWLVTR